MTGENIVNIPPIVVPMIAVLKITPLPTCPIPIQYRKHWRYIIQSAFDDTVLTLIKLIIFSYNLIHNFFGT